MSMVKHKRGDTLVLRAEHQAELKTLSNKADDVIDYSDIPPSDDTQWAEAARGKFYRPL